MPKPPGNRKKLKGSSVKASTAKPRAKGGGSGGGRGGGRPALTAEQLYERAQAAIAFERYDAALECMRDALQLEPENIELLDAHGALLAELGRAEEAVQELRKAVALSPDEGFEKYMYLGQLLEGEGALAATHKGVELLQLDVERAQQEGGGSVALAKQLAAALCSLAEMKMGLAEDVQEVAADAEALLQRARGADASSPEPLQALASLRYEQGRAEEALGLLRESMKLWFKPQGGSEEEEEDDNDDEELPDAAEAEGGMEFRVPRKPTTMSEEEERARQGGGGEEDGSSGEWEDEDAEEDEEDEEDDGVPSYEFRFECAKMLLELDDTTEAAIQVLEDLIAENDSVGDVWHLLGLAYYSGGMLEEAADVCSRGLALLQKQGVGPDEDVSLAFADLQSAIEEAQAATGGGAGGGAGGAQQQQQQQQQEKQKHEQQQPQQKQQQQEKQKHEQQQQQQKQRRRQGKGS